MTAGITSYGYTDQSIPADKWAVWQKVAGARYMVASPDDCVVSPVLGGTRQVQVDIGYLGGQGILDQITSPQVVTLNAPASGTEFSLVSLTRNWQTVNASSVTVKNLGASYTAPFTRTNTVPGTIDDQPLGVFSLAAGSTDPVLFKDLRAMGGPNFYSMQAGLVPDDFAWLEQAGLTVHTGRVTWRRLLDPDSGNLIWDRDPTIWEGTGFLTESGLSATEQDDWVFSDSSLSSHAIRTSTGHVTLAIELRRRLVALGSTNNPTGHIDDERMVRIAVAELRPSFIQNCSVYYISSSNASFHGGGYIDTNGFVWITDLAPNTIMPTTNAGGWSLRVTASYDTEA